MTPRAAKVLAGVVGAVALVVVAGLVLVLAVLPAVNREAAPPSPGPVVEEYVRAVADGDAAAALAVSRVDAAQFDGASPALLTDEVLAGARERVTDPVVDEPRVTGAAAAATVRYTLGGEPREAELRLRFDEDAREWHVVDGLLGSVRVEGLGGDTVPVEVSGVTPDPDAECYGPCARTASYVLLAGAYDVRADLSGFELHPENTTPAESVVTVDPGTSQSVRYLAVPQGDPWPVVDGTPTDPSP